MYFFVNFSQIFQHNHHFLACYNFFLYFSYIFAGHHPEIVDSAILSCGPVQHIKDSRIRYSRDSLMNFRNSELSRKRPAYIDEGNAARCRTIEKGSEDSRFIKRSTGPVGGGGNGGGNSGVNDGTNISMGNERPDYRSGVSSGSGNQSMGMTTSTISPYLLPSFAVKRRPGEQQATKNCGGSSGGGNGHRKLDSTADQTGARRFLYMSGNSNGGNNSQLLGPNSNSGILKSGT